MGHFGSIASNYTKDDLDANVTISSNSCIIYGLYITNTDNSTVADVIVYESDGTTEIMRFSVATNDMESCDTPFLADNGVIVGAASGATGTAVHVTAFHSNASGAA